MADDVTITIRLAQVGQFVRDSKDSRNAIRDVGDEVDRADRKSRIASAVGGGFGLLGKALAGIARMTTVAAVGIGSVATVIGVQSVNAATDLNETLQKTDVVFGKSARTMKAWGLTTAASLGMSQNESLSAAANLGNLFSNLGASTREASNMSKQLVTTAADLASFNNTSPQEMLEAVSSALAGEFDPLQRYGFAISAAAVQQKALKMGLAESTKELTAADTAQAAYAVILEQTGKATGDFARNGEGLANTQRKLAAQWEDLKGKAGRALLPAVLAVATALNTELLPAMADWVEDRGPAITAWITEFVTGKAVPFARWLIDMGTKWGPTAFRWIGSAAGNVVEFIGWMRDLGEQAGPKVTTWFAEFGSAAAGADGKNLSGLTGSLRDLVAGLGDIGGSLGEGVGDTINVAAVALGFLADHTDLLAKSMPYLVAALVLYKGAQAAANVGAAFAVPMKIAEFVVNTRLTASQNRLTAAMKANTIATRGSTVATGGDTAVKNVGILATIRQRAATIGSTIATKAAAVATKIWAAGQWVLNAALTANPIGLVVLAVVALIAIFVLAYKKIGWFRTGVQASMRFVLGAVRGVWGWAKKNWPLLLGILTGPIGLAVVLIAKNLDKIKAGFKGLVNGIIGIWNGLDLQIAVPGWVGKIPGVPEGIAGKSVDLVPDIPMLATGGRAIAPGVAIVGEAGPELITLQPPATVVPLDPAARQSFQEGFAQRPIQLILDRKVVAEVAMNGRNDIAARR